MSPTADLGVASMIPAWSHTVIEIDHEKYFYCHSPFTDSRRVVGSYKRKYEHKVLVYRFVKIALEKNVVRMN